MGKLKSAERTHRLNIDLGPRAYETLLGLQKATEASSQVETIRFALQTLSKIVEETSLGGRVVIQRKNGDSVEILIPLPR